MPKPSEIRHNRSDPTQLKAGDIELEMGIPIPGVILPKEAWVQTALKRLPVDGVLDMESLFQRVAPLAIDIGCGNGRFAISSAVRRPEWNHLAIDILPAVIRYGTRRGNQRGLGNLRFAVCDGWRLLDSLVPSASVHEIHIYHPQPFSEFRGSRGGTIDAEAEPMGKQRLLTPQFMVLMISRLVEGGVVYLQSDSKPYWEYIRSTMSQLFDWQEVLEAWPEDPHGRSRREVLAKEKGLDIQRGTATQRAGLTIEQATEIASGLIEPSFEIPIESSNVRHAEIRKRFVKRRRRK